MDRLRFTAFIALICSFFGPRANGATAANISIVSGNGQVTCPTCVSPQRNPLIQPLVVKVTDAAGNPVANQEVDWVVQPLGVSTDMLSSSITTTDNNGLATARLFETGQGGVSLNGFYQSNIIATLPTNGASATFTHAQSATDPNNHSNALVGAVQESPVLGDAPLRGVAGTIGTTPIRVRVDAFGQGVPNVSVRLIQENASDTATISCATGPGADPGSVLTDANGEAACNPVFGGKGSGSYNVLVGGVALDQLLGLSGPIGFRELFANGFTVTAATAGAIQIVSGNNQSVNQGQAAARLVAKITDVTGTAGIAGQTVFWSVTPVGAAILSNAVTLSDASGLVSTDVRLSNTATGTVQVKVTVGNLAAIFNITSVVNVSLVSIQKISGDSQSALVNANFGQQLVVQVNSTAGLASGIPVQFTISGPATLSNPQVVTDASGQARVTVTAGSTTGAVTVTATTGALPPVIFNLTVVPPGPSLTPSSFSNAAGSVVGSLSPCSLAIVSGSGVAPNVQGVLTPNLGVGPNPTTFAGASISVGGVAAPILSVSNVNGQQQIEFQVPCEVNPGINVPVSVTAGPATASANVTILPASPGLFETTMSDGVRRAVIVRPDGSFASLQNPVRKGEIARTYVTGLGPVAPPEVTNGLPTPGTDALVLGQVIVGVNNAGTRLVQARLAPNLIGVYEVAFQVPTDAPTSNDVVFSVGVSVPGDNQTRYSQGSKIPIQ